MATATVEECKVALSQARAALMIRPNSAFFATLALSLPAEFDEETPTAYTTGRKIVYGTEFFMKQNHEQRLFLILHETLHVAYCHVDPTRIQGRDPRIWNIAADYVINGQLVQSGFQMPEIGLHDTKYYGMGVEEVYEKIYENAEKIELSMDDLQPDMDGGEGKDSDGSDKAFSNELQQQAREMLVRASIRSRQSNDKPGSIPGDLQLMIDRLLNPKLPWQTILKRWFTAFDKTDYSFRKPNRRHWPDHILPSAHGESLGGGAMFVDASGSVSDDDFKRFISEVAGVMKTLKPKFIDLGVFDHGIRSVDRLHSFNDIHRIQFTGRGGTDVSHVMDWAKQKKPQFLILFSDGYFDVNVADPKIPVIWLVYDHPNFTAPFGKVIHFSMKE